jgi:hypothetical protein
VDTTGWWYTLAVGTPPLVATYTVDTAHAVSTLVPRAGGTLTATGADGVKYELTVPAGALTADTTITLTPLTGLAVADMASDASAGALLGPEGQTFVNPVTLRITPKAGTAWPVAKQIPIGLSGTNDRVSLATMDPKATDVTLSLMHFSSWGLLLATKGMDATLTPVRHRLGGDAEERIQSAVAEQLGRERQQQLLGASEGGDVVAGLAGLRAQYEKEVLNPRLAAAGDSCAAGRLALQTLLGYERQNQLLGVASDPGYGTTFGALVMDVLSRAVPVCLEEEYQICHDQHIITRILPVFLGLVRQAELLGMGSDPAGFPTWVALAEDYVRKCLQFDLQFDGSVAYSDTAYPAHTMSESVSSRVKIGYGLAFVDPLPGAPPPMRDFEGLVTGNFAPMVSSGYSPAYSERCVTLDSKTAKDGGLGVSFFTFTSGSGSVVDRATVKDFGISIAFQPNMSENTYTARTLNSSGACVFPNTITTIESFSTTGGQALSVRYTTPDSGVLITGWTVTQGSDIPATKDVSFTQSVANDTDSAKVTAHFVLFHKPL